MSCQIKVIGRHNLLLENNHILELAETRYVSSLQRNLISLGELDDEYNIRIHKGFTKIKLNVKEAISASKYMGFTLCRLNYWLAITLQL